MAQTDRQNVGADRQTDKPLTTDETYKHEQSGLPFCVKTISYNLSEVNEKHIHIHTGQLDITPPPVRGYCSCRGRQKTERDLSSQLG